MMQKVISQQSAVSSRSNEHGFTLLEVLLASFIFMSVVTIAIGSFSSQITLQGSAQAQRSVQQTSQAIIEAIARDVRVGGATGDSGFDIAGSCSGLPTQFSVCGDEITFDLPAGPNDRRRYRWVGDEMLVCRNPGVPCPQGDPLNDSSKVIVTDFRIEGVEPASDPLTQLVQPFVVIRSEE